MGEDDRTLPKRRTTVAEAARILGISAEAVRGRIRRRTLPVEREAGAVYVLLDRATEDRINDDQTRPTGDRPTDRTDALIAELQDRIRALEEANSENRRIIAALTSRIPAIEAPSEADAPESPASGDEQQGRGDVPRDPQRPAQRPFWRRFFGD